MKLKPSADFKWKVLLSVAASLISPHDFPGGHQQDHTTLCMIALLLDILVMHTLLYCCIMLGMKLLLLTNYYYYIFDDIANKPIHMAISKRLGQPAHTCYIPVKLPGVFPRAPLKFNGAPGNIQGNLTGVIWPTSTYKCILVWTLSHYQIEMKCVLFDKGWCPCPSLLNVSCTGWTLPVTAEACLHFSSLQCPNFECHWQHLLNHNNPL